ncbi:MAG: HlyD family efflux transporter periplasmic adaptor subunit [Deltaproteobacteria bacterium]
MKLASLMLLVLAAASGQTAQIDKSGARKPAAAKSVAGKPASDKSAGDATVIESALVTVIEEAEIPAKVEGVLSTVEVREGKMIEAGGIVARIEDAEVRLTHDRAKIEYEIAHKQADNDLKVRLARKSTDVARAELKRALESVEKYKKSVSDTELDRLRLAAERAELEIDQALHEQETARLTSRLKEIEMELAKEAVDRRTLISPISGMVVQVNLHQGEWVQAGKTAVRVLRVDRLRVEGFVFAKNLNGDLVGRRVTLEVDLPGKQATRFEGAVVFVSPEVNPVNGQVRVWAEVDNPKLLLRPGLRGSLTIDPPTAQTAKREMP